MAQPVAVVVPTHNRADRLRRLVGALERQELRPAEVVFVDDASTDETPTTLAELARTTTLPFKFIRLDRPAGPGGAPNGNWRSPAAARNSGWRSTSAPLVAFTDDDCEPESTWLARAVALIESQPRVGIVQGAVRPDPSAAVGGWAHTREVTRPTAWFEGCNLLLRRDALESAGGFSEAVWRGEDTWLGWVVLRSGWERSFAADALVYHDVTFPGFRWHLHQSWLIGGVVPLAREFPALRKEFWLPWAFRPSHPALLSFIAGLVLYRWRRAAVALMLPYLYLRVWRDRPYRPNLTWVRDRVYFTTLDATEVASTLLQAVRNRIFVI
jgi:GT2 family glycosyltransferase